MASKTTKNKLPRVNPWYSQTSFSTSLKPFNSSSDKSEVFLNNYKNPKVYVFIDSQNLNLGILDQGWKLDFARFRIYLKNKFKVKKAFLFIGYIKKNQKLYDTLKKAGYKLIFKPVTNKKGEIKGNVDAELVLHTMIEFDNYDKAVIVSGDGDFHCLIEYLLKKKKLAGMVIPNKYKYSSLLRKFSKFIDFLNLQREVLQKKEA